MQANNDPNWTDDAAFWNEAWADMNQRLDQEPPTDRKIAVVWWRRYGWLLGFVLLITAVATPTAVAYFSQDGKLQQEQVAPPAPVAPTPSPAEVIAADSEVPPVMHSGATTRKQDRITGTKSNPNSFATSKDKKGPLAYRTQAPAGTSIPNLPPTSVNEVVYPDDRVTTSSPSENITTAAPNEVTPNTAAHVTLVKEVPTAMLPLAFQQIEPVAIAHNPGLNQLNAVVPKARLASRFYAEAGTSSGLKGNGIGYYAGIQYSLPVSKRISIPAGVRVRRDFHQFAPLAESDTPARFLDVGNSTTSSAPDTILFEFTSDNLREVITTSVEARIGVAYAATPRLRIGASLSVNYLQTAIARVSPQYQQELAADQSRFLNADADITLVDGLSFARENASLITPGAVVQISNGTSSDFPKFVKWMTYGGLDLSYDLTRKLTLNLAGRRLLAQPDQSEVIGLQRGQVEMGIRWRLK